MVQAKALACELPHRKGLPLSRFSITDIRQEVLDQGLVAVHRGAVDESRKIKPEISLLGEYGIPIRDELELEMLLT